MGEPLNKELPWPRLGLGGDFGEGPPGGGPPGGGPGGPGRRGTVRPGMPVIAFASRSEGSGKTVLAAHVAVMAELAGAGPVAIVDTDPQGSLGDWWNEREAEAPVFGHNFVSRVGENLNRLRELGIKLCVVDTPAAVTTTSSGGPRKAGPGASSRKPSIRASGSAATRTTGNCAAWCRRFPCPGTGPWK